LIRGWNYALEGMRNMALKAMSIARLEDLKAKVDAAIGEK
jgi:hypothetical protein